MAKKAVRQLEARRARLSVLCLRLYETSGSMTSLGRAAAEASEGQLTDECLRAIAALDHYREVFLKEQGDVYQKLCEERSGNERTVEDP